MQKVITIDCDDVLSETIDALLKYYNYNIYGKKIYREDVASHDFEKIKKYHYSFDERYYKDIDFFLHKDSLHLIKPLIGAKEKLLEFKEKGYKLYVITGRPDELKKHTLDRIDLNYHNLIEDVYFANADKDSAIPKSKFCEDLGSEFMVEDDLRFARDIASKGIKVYLLDKPWNQDYDEKDKDMGIVKIQSWDEIEA